jgi:hypothetical protein
MGMFFRDEKMMKMSNLIGTDNFNIYSKCTENVYKEYMKLYHFVKSNLINLGFFNKFEFELLDINMKEKI